MEFESSGKMRNTLEVSVLSPKHSTVNYYFLGHTQALHRLTTTSNASRVVTEDPNHYSKEGRLGSFPSQLSSVTINQYSFIKRKKTITF